ncbi:MAG: single-stranded-DNA-specific exonuclease RecJ [Oscillospiraceae bacterium]|nr:single-stranded-DNA-specific exonuclease RecJ [Oscillospiraceae bacterium]
MKKWTVKTIDSKAADAETISPVITGLGTLAQNVLAVRGIVDVDSAHEFFTADKLYDPFLLKDMPKAVELIKDALSEGTKITVYGDYDCDGITATVMLYSYLTALGGEVGWYIPSRDEGYGLNAVAVEKIIADGTGLIITVDNGITAFEEAKLISEKGTSLIITDHHTPPAEENELPIAGAIINPKQKGCKYPFKELAGCGVVLKLIAAMESSLGGESIANLSVIEQYGDMAAIGTIADIVPLNDENRHIVSLGLQSIECSENIGLYSLMKATGISETYNIDSTSIAFILCPRINAAGRLAHPGKAVELFLCENHELAAAKAEELNALNQQRCEEERRIIDEIEVYLDENPTVLNERVLVLIGNDWHHGIIGIICSRMVTRFGKPCAIVTTDGVTGKGSFRSVKGFSVHEALSFCKDTLIKYGGHIGAGGFSVEDKNIPAFKQALFQYSRQKHDSMPPPEVIADLSPGASDITIENIEHLEALQPFGVGSSVPVFFLPCCKIKNKRPLKEGKYISFTAEYSGGEFKVLDFSRCYSDFWYKIGDTVDLMVNFSINEYNGSRNISVKLVDMRLSGIDTAVQEKYFAAKSVYEKILRGEEEDIDKKLYLRIIPGNEEMKKAYNIIKNSFCLDEVSQKALAAGINYCMLRVIIDIFQEAGIVEHNPVTGAVKTIKTEKKADLEKSVSLIKLIKLSEGGL